MKIWQLIIYLGILVVLGGSYAYFEVYKVKEKQAQQDFGRNGYPTYGAVVGINPTQIQLGDHIYDEARQVVRRQGFAHGDREIECGFVIGSLELSAHAYILPQIG